MVCKPGAISFTLSFNVLERDSKCNICSFHITFKMYVEIKIHSRKKKIRLPEEVLGSNDKDLNVKIISQNIFHKTW